MAGHLDYFQFLAVSKGDCGCSRICILAFLLGIYLGVEMLGSQGRRVSALIETPKQFPEMVVPIFPPTISLRAIIGCPFIC